MSHPPQPGPRGGPGPYGGPVPYGAPGGPVGTPYGWSAPREQRPGQVTAAGVITAVLGGLGILAGIGVGILVALFGAFLGQIAEGKAPGEGAAAEITTAFVAAALGIALVSVLFSGLYLALGLRVLRRGRVARVVLTVWNVVVVLVVLALVVLSLTHGDDIASAISLLLTTAPLLAVVVLLWTGAGRDWFDRAPTA